MTGQKRIGILTSGGDCPGLNAILHAVLNLPSASDRLLATAFGIKAIDVIAREMGNFQLMVIWQQGEVRDRPLVEVTSCLKQAKEKNPCASPVDPDGFTVQVARALGIYLGA